MIRYLFLAALWVIPCIGLASGSDQVLPREVSSFIEERELCNHFRGEYPYNEERKRFLKKNIIDLCTDTDKKLAQLKRKYKDNPGIIKSLSGFEEKIEINNQESKQ